MSCDSSHTSVKIGNRYDRQFQPKFKRELFASRDFSHAVLLTLNRIGEGNDPERCCREFSHSRSNFVSLANCSTAWQSLRRSFVNNHLLYSISQIICQLPSYKHELIARKFHTHWLSLLIQGLISFIRQSQVNWIGNFTVMVQLI